MSDLICGKAAVGGNYNSTRDNWFEYQKFEQSAWKEYVQKRIGESADFVEKSLSEFVSNK